MSEQNLQASKFGSISIESIGLISSAGVGVRQNFCSVSASISQISEVERLYCCMTDEPEFEPARRLAGGVCRFLDKERKRYPDPIDWLAYLSALAYFDLARSRRRIGLSPDQTGLFLSLPEKRPGWTKKQSKAFFERFFGFIGRYGFRPVEFCTSGHSGMIELMEGALSGLEKGDMQAALVGGVDSYFFAPWLEELDRNYRLKSDRNVDGFIPGEAAGFVLLRNPVHKSRTRTPTQYRSSFRVKKCQHAKCSPEELQNNTGVTLSNLLLGLLEGEEKSPIVFCDLNGEPVRMREWGFTLVRLGKKLGSPCIVEHPAVCLGDTAAASGSVLVALAIYYLDKIHTERQSAVVWTASDDGCRSGVLIQRVKNV